MLKIRATSWAMLFQIYQQLVLVLLIQRERMCCMGEELLMANQRVVEQSDSSFDARHYWEERLLKNPGITGVGYLGRAPQFIEVQYRSRKQQLDRALREHQLINLSGRSVLDVGSGTGIWLDYWRQHGADCVAGLDFAQLSVDRLKKQFPDLLIVQADLSVSPLPLPQGSRYDIISAFDVLLHIVDPDGFRHAIANLAEHCAPGGWLIISDAIVQGQHYVPTRHSTYDKVRSLAYYREVLEANGFTTHAVRPATVLLNNPLEASGRLTFLAFLAFWKASGLWGHSNLLSRLLGPAMISMERLACKLYPDANTPGVKTIFARKQG